MGDPDPEHLRRAADHFDAAAEAAGGEAGERLAGFADQCRTLADRDRGPDHGRLARILTPLSDIEPAVGDEAADRVRRAREELTTYREDVEGV